MEIMNVLDWNKAKDNLLVVLRNKVDMRYDANELPHKEFADLNMFYLVVIEDNGSNIATVKVTNRIMEIWGIQLDELHDIAIKNSGRLYPEKLMTLGDAVGIDVDPENNPTSAILILTNSVSANGAAALFYEGVVDCLVDNLGSGIMLLPASVNEWLIVPESFGSAEELKKIVRNVNMGSVSADDRLSNNVYKISNGNLVIADSLQ